MAELSGIVGPIRIASQLGRDYDAAIAARLDGHSVELVPIPRGPALALPADIGILFAAPFHKAGGPVAAQPAGWPFGLRWVQLISAGTDLYPPWLFDGPMVSNASGTLAAPIAEYALALIFAAAKQFPRLWIHERKDWRLYEHSMVEGSTLGIFGFGAIGENLARRASLLGMNVHAVRRSDQPMPRFVSRVGSLAALAAISDHLVLAAPGNAETRHIVSAELLAAAKPGLHLVNVARGSLVDNDALLAALETGQVGLASLDVADPEPLPDGHPFYTHPRVRLSPHTSPIVSDSKDRVAVLFAENLRRYLAGGSLTNLVFSSGVT